MNANDEYQKAKKLGEKAYRKAAVSGQYPYLPALEEFLTDQSSDIGISAGIMEIPLSQVAGTKTRGRQGAFACNFMPLLDVDSEFAQKWINLYIAQDEEGIRDPVKVYEYMWNFYVLEGNKRVSVLKYLEMPLILADVIRVLPENREDPEVKVYMEFDRFFRVAPLYDIIFSKEGSYQKLAEAVGQNLEDPWPEELKRSLSYAYDKFAQAYDASMRSSLNLSVSDAFLAYLTIYRFESFEPDSPETMKKKLAKIREELINEASGKQVAFVEEPEKEAKASIFKSRPYHEKNPLRIAFLYDGALSGSSWLYGHELGRNKLADLFPGIVETWPYENTQDPEAFQKAVEDAAEKEAHVIISTSPTQMEETLRAAVEFPQIRFLNCSINLSHTAVRTYYGRMHEAKFLMGVLAGTLTKKLRIGYVADYPIYGAISRINAFAIGAALANPEVKVYLTWTSLADGDWKSFMQERDVQIISGPDLIKPAEASREYGLYRMEEGGNVTNLAMPVWDWGTYYELIVRGILDGTFGKENANGKGQALNLWWGMSAGVIDVILSKNLPYYSEKMIDIYRKALINDTFRPFDGILKDNQGNVRGERESVLSNEEIVSMDWLNDNVIGMVPSVDLLTEAGKKAVAVSGVRESGENA